MAFSPCVYFLIIACLAVCSLHFGCTTESDKGLAFNSKEQTCYDALEPADRGPWMRQLLIKKNQLLIEKDQLLIKKDQLLIKKDQRITFLEADNVFSKFICAMNLLKRSIETIIRRVGFSPKKILIKRYPSERAKKLIERLLPEVNESIIHDVHKLSKNFYRSIAGSNTATARNLRSALLANGHRLWKSAAVAAGVKELCNSYLHFNRSQAINIYRAYLVIGHPIQFPDIIRKKNNWNLKETDMKIVNILLSHIREYPIAYEKFTLKNGKEVVLPVQDPNSIFTTCL